MVLHPDPVPLTEEPMELRVLKQKLAALSRSTCKCYNSRSRFMAPVLTSSHSTMDKEVQAEEHKTASSDRFTQANPNTIRREREEFMNSMTKDVLCPSCYVTMNLLRGGVLKILKDEESETKNIFSCDKATDKSVKAIEKTTSITRNPVLKNSNLTLRDFITNDCDNVSFRQPPRVKFTDVSVNAQYNMPSADSWDEPRGCFCLENFVDSIRPPIVETR